MAKDEKTEDPGIQTAPDGPASPIPAPAPFRFDLFKALDPVEARKFLIHIRAEAFRLGHFNVSVEHMGAVLGSQAGTKEFDDHLEHFLEAAELDFEPLAPSHVQFRPAAVLTNPLLAKKAQAEK